MKRKTKRKTPARGAGGRFLPRRRGHSGKKTKRVRALQVNAGAKLLAARRELLAAYRSGNTARINVARAEAERAGIAVILVE